MSRRIYAYSPHVTPYNDHLFREIAKHLDGLEVIYRARVLKSHPWKSSKIDGYRHRFGSYVLGIDWNAALLPVRDSRALYWVAGWDSATGLAALSLLRLLGRDYIVWTDTPDPQRNRSPIRKRVRAAWIRWVFSGAKAVLGTGKPGVDGVAALGAPTDRVVNFPFILDLDRYARASEARPAPARMRFVSSGRVLNSLKGHDVAVRAFAKAAARCSVPFEYIVAGTGPDLESLKSLAQQLGIGNQVRCIGWAEAAQLREILRESDVLVHPSPIHDPFPNAVLEGMAAGMAVLGSSISGSVIDRVADGETGFIHAPGDVEELAAHIERCLADPALVARMGQRSAAIARQWPVERSVTIIKDLAEGRFPALARLPWPAET